MTGDPALDLLRQAITVQVAVSLGDRTSARAALFELSRLLPVVKVQVQQIRGGPDDARDLEALFAAKYPQPPPVDGAGEGDGDAST